MTSLCFALLVLAGSDTPADAWPGFRGRGDGFAGRSDLPLHWSPTKNLAWKVEVPGYGQSSPVHRGGRVYTTAVDGPEREKGYVLAYDARTGKKLWEHRFAPTQKAKWTFTVSRAAPTPIVGTDAVFAFFEGGDLLALAHDGKPLWSRSLVKDYGEFQNGHGLGASPVLTEKAVVVLIDHAGPSYLLAVDRKTGKNLWKVDRPSRRSWTSPTVVGTGADARVIVSSNGHAAAYEAETGKLVWEMDGLTGNTMPSPAPAEGGRILLGAGMGRGKGDAGEAARSNCCLLPEKTGFKVAWRARKALCSYASPLGYRGHAYFVNQVGIVHCLDLKSGAERYAERLEEPCWASPIAAGDHIWFFGRNGRTTVIRTGPKFERVAVNALWEDAGAGKDKGGRGGDYDDPILYGVAAGDGAFFVRTGTTLTRIGLVRP